LFLFVLFFLKKKKIKIGKVCTIAKINHVTQGQRAAYMQAELVEFPAGRKYNDRFRVDQSVIMADLEFVRTEFKEISEDGKKLILTVPGLNNKKKKELKRNYHILFPKI